MAGLLGHRRTAALLLACGGCVLGSSFAGTAAAQVPVERDGIAATVRPAVVGNPLAKALVPPSPAPPVPVADPGGLPRGASPAVHVYATLAAGQPLTYVAVEFAVPAGLLPNGLSLTAGDDGAAGEDVAADTAVLMACPLTGPMSAASPDAPVEHDCATHVLGVRVATPQGGSWTFDLDALRRDAGRPGSLGVAIVPMGAQPAAFSVSLTRAGFDLAGRLPEPVRQAPPLLPASAPVTGADSDQVQPVSGLPAAPPVGPLDPVPAPRVAELLAPSLAAAQVLRANPTAGLQLPLSPRSWNALLLLLVPAIPFLSLAVNRRLLGDQGDADVLAELFPVSDERPPSSTSEPSS